MSQIGLPVEAFQSWLEAHREEVMPCVEVLGLWLSDLFGEPYIAHSNIYGPARYDVDEGVDESVMGDLPPWAKCFQEDVVRISHAREMRGTHFLSVLEETLQHVSTVPVLDASAFREWAAARPDGYAGETADACECPLAYWLRERCGEGYMVGSSLYGPECYAFNFPMPEWAVRFVETIDKRFRGNKVTGAEVCAVLDELAVM
jgi:hypothetical protein